MQELTDGLWRWTARHPEWHPGDFGAEVACFAARADDTTLLIDPLLPRDPARVLAVIDEILGDRLAILITIPYHVRSSEQLWRRRVPVNLAVAARVHDRRHDREGRRRDRAPSPPRSCISHRQPP